MDGESGDQRQLLAAARSGEEWAWRSIFDEHYPPLYRFFRSRVATSEQAEDLASDVFLQAFRSIEHFRWRGAPFRAWLFGIARNVLASHYRGRPHVEFVRASELDLRYTRPEFIALEVRDALERLAHDHRVALELRYVVGLSGEEAAALMGRTHGAFRSLLYRAVRAFQREAADDADPLPDAAPLHASAGA